MHKFKVIKGISLYDAKILLDEQPFQGTTSININMEVGNVTKINVELIPEYTELEYQDSDIFIKIGQKKYRLLECVGDAECTQDS